MRGSGSFGYARLDPDVALVELPFQGDRLSLVVLLPREIDGLPALEARLTPDLLGAWLASLHATKVEVFLPRFTLTWGSTELIPALKALGIHEAFGRAADFGGVEPTRELYINHVFHKTFVEVNEEGTEAAAATGVVMARKAVAARPPTFRADHPFLFLIRDRQTGAILFLGRLLRP